MSTTTGALLAGRRERLALVGLVALIAWPLALALPVWVSLATGLLLVWQFASHGRGRRPPALALRILLTAACLAGVFFAFGRINGQDAGVSLLVLMLALKLTELTGARDGFVVLALCCFLLTTEFLFSQSIGMAVWLAVGAWAVLAVFVYLHTLAGGGRARHAATESALLMALAIPIAIALFLLFPRLPGPLWGLPANDRDSGITGLSDRMTPGSISHLARSDAVAFRARFDDTVPPKDARYWRGPVLWDYVDGTWLTHGTPPEAATVHALSSPINIAITLEPSNQRWLLALDVPLSARRAYERGGGATLVTDSPIRERIRYVETSAIRYRLGTELSSATRRRALALPANGNPRARALARRWANNAASTQAIVNDALAMYRRLPFHYTLNAPKLAGGDRVDAFLFQTRAGFCEHYAGSFTFLMRAAGVPARVVTGFLGAEKADYGDYWIVRNADAHAWSEVWIAGKGWVRVDPTAAVAPSRIDDGVAAAVGDAGDLAFMSRGTRGDPWFDARMAWDGINAAWNQWFLAYGPALQQRLFGRLGLDGFGPAIALLTGLVLAGLIGASIALGWRMRLPRPGRDVLARAWHRIDRRLAREELSRRRGETTLAQAGRVANARPDLAVEISALAQAYTRLRYAAPPADEATKKEFVRRARRFRTRRRRR